MFNTQLYKDTSKGILLAAVLSCLAFYIAQFQFIKSLSLSPLIIGIILGIGVANSMQKFIPIEWHKGIKICTKQILRIGIILYGFRLTLTQVAEIGLPAIIMDIIIISGTIGIGVFIGKMIKHDVQTTLMTSIGSAICGAAAVLGAEPVVKCESHKTAIAVSTVVIFGTLSMFLYPIFYRLGLFEELSNSQIAIYTGSTLHEVAHVAGAGNAMDPTDELGIAGTATITKMIRVILLAPVLIVLAFSLKMGSNSIGRTKITIPWFAVWFIIIIIFNTMLQSTEIISAYNMKTFLNGKGCYMEIFDTFLLTMAMTALGLDTTIDKFKKAGAKPFLLAAMIYIWLVCGGYLLTRYLVPLI